jgi:hypothetical protein
MARQMTVHALNEVQKHAFRRNDASIKPSELLRRRFRGNAPHVSMLLTHGVSLSRPGREQLALFVHDKVRRSSPVV